MGDESNDEVGGRASRDVYPNINMGEGYFEKASKITKSIRPDYVKAYATKVRMLCSEGKSLASAEKEADAQYGSVKEWVASEKAEKRNGNIYGGSPPVSATSASSSPRTYPAPRPGSPYSINSNNRKSRRYRRSNNSRRSNKSKKSKKT
jgi:hypothetical protein